jgi:hypothetical protein
MSEKYEKTNLFAYCLQGRSVHVNRDSPANTLKNEKIKSLLSYFLGSVVLRILEHGRTDQLS